MATKKAASPKKSKTTTSKKPTVKQADTTVTTSMKLTEKITNKKPLLQGRSPLLGAFIAEFIGTFILACVALAVQGNTLLVGFALIAIVLTIGVLSGAHVNPLITVGAWVTRKISGKRALGYVAAQVLGGMLALVAMTAYAQTLPQTDEAAQQISFGQQQLQLFQVASVTGKTENVIYILGAELLAAVIFGFAVSSAMRERRDRTAQAFTIGLGLFIALTIGGGAAVFVGGSVIANPAIALSMKAITWPLTDMWAVLVYIAAPLVGGAGGFFLFDVIRGESDGGDDKLLSDEL